VKFDYAQSPSFNDARAILFSADTNAAGHSESHLGAQQFQSRVRSPDFIREASNQSPSLPKNFMRGSSLYDDGVLKISGRNAEEQVVEVKEKFLEIWKSGRVPICLGGDHLVKHAALRALQDARPETLIVYVDAHPDIVQSNDVNYATVIHHALVRRPQQLETVFLVGLRQINEAEAQGLKAWKPKIIWGQDFYTQQIG
jgi:agmatinase